MKIPRMFKAFVFQGEFHRDISRQKSTIEEKNKYWEKGKYFCYSSRKSLLNLFHDNVFEDGLQNLCANVGVTEGLQHSFSEVWTISSITYLYIFKWKKILSTYYCQLLQFQNIDRKFRTEK